MFANNLQLLFRLKCFTEMYLCPFKCSNLKRIWMTKFSDQVTVYPHIPNYIYISCNVCKKTCSKPLFPTEKKN